MYGKVIFPGNYPNGHALAYILSASRNGYDKDSIQKAYWQILDPLDDIEHTTKSERLTNNATTYQNFKNNSNNNVNINYNNASTTISDNIAVYGPIKIYYNCMVATNDPNTQFGGFNYAFFDNNGNNINNKVSLCKRTNNVYQEVESNPYTPTSNTSANESEYECYQVRSIDYNGIDLYVKIDLNQLQNVGNIKMKIQKNTLDITATVYQLVGQETITKTSTDYCESCRLKGPGYNCPICKTDTHNRNKTQTEKLNEGYAHFANNHFSYLGGMSGGSSWRCEYCRTTVSGTGTAYNEKFEHAQRHVTLDYGCRINKCGETVYAGKYPRQKLSILYEYTVRKGGEDVAEFDIQLIPSVDITLQKYNSYIATNKTPLTGAEFSIIAKQDGEIISNGSSIQAGETKTIQPNSYNPIYVTIQETNAPSGYTTIKEPINIIYYINDNHRSWNPTYCPTQEAWNESGFTWGNWTWIDDGDNNFPNDYRSKSGDIITVDEVISSGKQQEVIKVYNDAVIEELTLLKVDADELYEDGNNKILPGATFRVKIKNIKSYKYGNQVIKDDIKDNEYEVEYKLESGNITLNDIVLANENDDVVITLTEIKVPTPKYKTDGSIEYYYKKLEGQVTITLKHNPTRGFTLVNFTYSGSETITVNGNTKNTKTDALNIELNSYVIEIKIPNERLIDISGKVWLDGQTGLKPTIPANGEMESTEQGVAGVIVELIDDNENIVKQFYYNDNNELLQPDAKDITDEDGTYNFKGIDWGQEYKVRFIYDGINYEDTLYNVETDERNSDAQENATTRNTFNDKFHTITYKLATSKSVKDEQGKNVTTDLTYSYNNGKSTLETLETNGTAKKEFSMSAQTIRMTLKANTKNIDLGLVKRGTDLALSTDVYNAEVSINGQTTDYTYNGDTIVINETGTNTVNTTYNLGLYSSDYNYRIRYYISNSKFIDGADMNAGDTPKVEEKTATTGEELDVYVIYKVNLRNQSSSTAYVNEVKYSYDSKYEFCSDLTEEYNVKLSGITRSKEYDDPDNSVIIINLDGLELKGGQTATRYLVFKVKEANGSVNLGEFSNTAEIMSYSTDYGLIDTDSQPGNFFKDGQSEDDNNTADTLVIDIKQNPDNPDNPGNPDNPNNSGNPDNPGNPDNSDARKITGYVFDENNNKVDDVIVQLIELKNFNGTMYEYIWQETVSGSGTGKRINSAGTELEDYTYTKVAGQYEFQGFIPGDYIVRFIYGDGSTYDLTNNVITYNGQDYKSMADSNYNAEWYNTSSYTTGASVARDNEARRLETMAYSVNVDAKKGILLKLLDSTNIDDFNEVEKETLIEVYTDLEENIETLTNEELKVLLQYWVLPETWMCAETSKIKVAVDTEQVTNTKVKTIVDGKNSSSYIEEIDNINLGLAKRPETKIELKKYITGFKLTASNGQVLVNARVDVNKYLDGTENISDEVQGIKNNVTILGTLWQYEVSPTELNTIVEGAKLEYEYTLVVRNTGENDNLSDTLINKYNSLSIGDYTTYLNTCSDEMKTDMRLATRKKPIGTYLGGAYYTTSNGYTSGNVQTEVTKIRDYINNDLTKTPSGDVTIDEEASEKEYRVLRDDYSTQKVKINTVLKTTRTTGKMQPGSNDAMYTVTLGRDPISSTGTISFENYIAEVMSYTNAAGRRATTSTPGNAEIIDAELREGRTHEIDEADTGRIQIGVKTGEDEETNYILITAIAAGILLIAVGAFVTKKYIIK